MAIKTIARSEGNRPLTLDEMRNFVEETINWPGNTQVQVRHFEGQRGENAGFTIESQKQG